MSHLLSFVFHAVIDGYFYAGVVVGVVAHVSISRLVARIESAALKRLG